MKFYKWVNILLNNPNNIKKHYHLPLRRNQGKKRINCTVVCSFSLLILSPHHFIYNSGIALNYLYHLGGNVLFHVYGNGDAVVTVFRHIHSSGDRLQKTFFVNARKNKAGLIPLR